MMTTTKKLVSVSVCVMTAIILSISAWITTNGIMNDEISNLEAPNAYFVLVGELPSDQPVLHKYQVTSPSTITNETEAKAYVCNYFQEFTCETFYQRSNGTYWAMQNNKIIQVSPLGQISYSDQVNDTEVSVSLFTPQMALSDSNAFINNHGGISPFSHFSTNEIKDRNANDTIWGYRMEYKRQLEEFTIYGMDGISTIVFYNEPISYYYISKLTYEISNEQQVISATTAFNALNGNSIKYDLPSTPINITTAELVYYQPLGITETVSFINPAWRFVSDTGSDYFIDAFTAEMF